MKTVKADEFNLVDGVKYFILFSSDNCFQCKCLEDKLNILSKEFIDVVFYKLEFPQSRSIFDRFSIECLPTIVVTIGEEVKRVVVGDEGVSCYKDVISNLSM
jgi:hypothetical protein